MTIEECSTEITALKDAMSKLASGATGTSTETGDSKMENSLAMLLGQNANNSNSAAMWNNP